MNIEQGILNDEVENNVFVLTVIFSLRKLCYAAALR